MAMKPVHIDETGVSDDTPEGIEAWQKKYDQMISEGATKKTAIEAADSIKAKMDKVGFNGYVIEENT